jgi:hypothetical protein
MDTKGDFWDIIRNMVLALAILVILIVVMGNQFSIFTDSINYCSGVCVPDGTCQSNGGTLIYEGTGSCPDGTVCCKSDELQRLKQAGNLPAGSPSIQLGVTGTGGERVKTYRNQDSVPNLYVGGTYTFTADIREFSDDQQCAMYIMDGNTDAITGNRFTENLRVPAEDNTYTDCDELQLETTFTSGNLQEDLELDVIVRNGSEDTQQIASAKFFLDMNNPIAMSFSNEWSNEHEITVSCKIQCEAGDLGVVEDAEQCRQGLVQGPFAELDFLDDKANVELDASSFTTQEFSRPLCARVNVSGVDVFALSDAFLKHDARSPTISLDTDTLDDGLGYINVTCNDLSGCDEIHYTFARDRQAQPGDTFDDFQDTKLINIRSAWQDLESEFDREACPPPMSGNYRTTTRNEIPVGDLYYGALCVYAVDEAGNTGSPETATFLNTGLIVDNTVGSITIGDVIGWLS